MKNLLGSVLASSLARYIVTGGFGFLVEIVVIASAVRLFGTSPVVAVAISFWIGIVASFMMQKLFTFRNRQASRRALTWQSVTYAALVGFNYIFTLAFVALVEPRWHSPELARTAALVITTAWNYIVYRYLIFR